MFLSDLRGLFCRKTPERHFREVYYVENGGEIMFDVVVTAAHREALHPHSKPYRGSIS